MLQAHPIVPDLFTERLELTAHRVEDLDDCYAMWSDPGVVRHIGGRPFHREEVWQRLLRYRGHWDLLGYGFWVVRDRATRRFLGEAGLLDGQRDLSPKLDAPVVGYAPAPHAHGRGYATEALGGVLAWADGVLKAPKTLAIIEPENAPSLAVARKHGFQQRARLEYHGAPILLLERVTALPRPG